MDTQGPVVSEGYIHLPLDTSLFERLPLEIELPDGSSLERKTEFHVSLMNTAFVAALVCTRTGLSEQVVKEQLIELFTEHAHTLPPVFTGFLPDFRIATKEERMSVVVRCEVSNLEPFFAVCEQEYDMTIPRQPLHVTIYTRGHNKGIGINTIEDMEQLQQISLPEVQDALGVVS